MTAEEIFRWIGEARRGNRAYFSNAFYTVSQLQEFLAEKDVRVIASEDLILLLQEDFGLYRVQFFARSPEALSSLPALLPELDGPIVVDLVGKEPAVGQQAELVARYGFAPYSVFVRMICRDRILPGAKGIDRVELARESDAETILAMIERTFDPLFAHFPTIEEICEAICREEISVIRDGDNIAGLAFFEKKSETYYILRYFIVDAGYRGQNIGGALLHSKFISAPENAVYMLWVGTYNSAQSLYKKFGFVYDGLTDYILKYGGNNRGEDL